MLACTAHGGVRNGAASAQMGRRGGERTRMGRGGAGTQAAAWSGTLHSAQGKERLCHQRGGGAAVRSALMPTDGERMRREGQGERLDWGQGERRGVDGKGVGSGGGREGGREGGKEGERDKEMHARIGIACDPSPRLFATPLRHASSRRLFTAPLNRASSPRLFTAPLHRASSPRLFTTPLHHASSPRLFTW